MDGSPATMGAMGWLAERFMQLRGWRIVGEPPPFPKYVAIGAPHTSNWDFAFFLGVVSHFRIPGRVVGKESLVRWPFGRLMRRLGVIPLRRDSGQGLVEQMAGEFAARDRMALVVAPEGTRRRADHWRSGFYRIALAAEVPIVFSFVDFGTKTAGLGPTLYPTGDISADMEIIRDFYSPIQGKNPQNQGPISLSTDR